MVAPNEPSFKAVAFRIQAENKLAKNGQFARKQKEQPGGLGTVLDDAASTSGEGSMTGGLRKTVSHLAIAAMFCVSGIALHGAKPAHAADLGGDCCADLEERVAELEATTVRKGNKKVSVTLWSGQQGSIDLGRWCRAEHLRCR